MSDALDYHRQPRPGKTATRVTRPLGTQQDLSLAYTPGVAEPVLAIAANPMDAYEYTNKGNLVAVISNGTSTLGLGNQGALPCKPVMEGKVALLKTFADIDGFDIEVDSEDAGAIIETVANIAPTFGAICLEDIRSPECFEVEEKLAARLRIPVFHDDQHGTAVVVAAALINALSIAQKQLSDVSIVMNGAGAAAVAIRHLLISLGANAERIIVCDSKGVIYRGRTENMKSHKHLLESNTPHRDVAEALVGADVFIGVSTAHCVSQGMAKSMAESPIIFALANPEPEIAYDQAKQARGDAIVATGRSDYPNQVNNLLGFPGIFRGALDARAVAINPAMKLAAVHALAALAHEPVPQTMSDIYGTELHFGMQYILPKPFDLRVVPHVAAAVAKAAEDSGVAQRKLDHSAYIDALTQRIAKARF